MPAGVCACKKFVTLPITCTQVGRLEMYRVFGCNKGLQPLLDEAYRVVKEGGNSLGVSESFKQFVFILKKEAM